MIDKKLQELFSTPTGLESEIDIAGTTFFSSDKLKNNFILALQKSSKAKVVAPQLETLVHKGIIIPCYKSKNVFSFIKHKLSKDPNKHVLAFYSVDKKKVIVLIDNSTSIFGTSSNNTLSSTTMHECMHLVAGMNLSKFIQVFKPYLQEYYSSFFEDYFMLTTKPNMNDLITFLSRYEKNGYSYANRDLANYFKFITNNFKDLTKLDEKDFLTRAQLYIVAAKLFIVNMQSLFRNAAKFSMLFTSLNRAYRQSFGKKNKYTTPIQETITLSEVACVLAEMKPQDPVIKKLFNIIT